MSESNGNMESGSINGQQQHSMYQHTVSSANPTHLNNHTVSATLQQQVQNTQVPQQVNHPQEPLSNHAQGGIVSTSVGRRTLNDLLNAPPQQPLPQNILQMSSNAVKHQQQHTPQQQQQLNPKMAPPPAAPSPPDVKPQFVQVSLMLPIKCMFRRLIVVFLLKILIIFDFHNREYQWRLFLPCSSNFRHKPPALQFRFLLLHLSYRYVEFLEGSSNNKLLFFHHSINFD